MIRLEDDITNIKYINDQYAKKLKKLGIYTVKDFLTHFPRKYNDASDIKEIKQVILEGKEGEEYYVRAKNKGVKSIRLRGKGTRTIQKAELFDDSGEINATWFNQPYLEKALKPNLDYIFAGKIKQRGSRFEFYPSQFEPVLEERELVHSGRIVPEYNLTAGVSKKWFRNRLKSVVDVIKKMEIVDELFEKDLSTVHFKTALAKIHFPGTKNDILDARKTLSTGEMVNIHLKILKQKKGQKIKDPPTIDIEKSTEILKDFVSNLPFELTNDQSEVLKNISAQMFNSKSINALIQGDVGSGKTVIAVTLALVLSKNGYQTAFLAPTTVLAEQHFKTVFEFLKDYKVDTSLVTGSTKTDGKPDILIGTSAILARKQDLIKNLGLIIVDEQHRFGVKQREELLKPLKKTFEIAPHFINMTATPIPRTIAETLFGDMQVEEIKSKPKGRKPVSTYVVPSQKRRDSYSWIEEKIENGEQVFWICPLIEESDKLNAKSAQEVYKELQEVYPKRQIALLHGKLKNDKKNAIMEKFKSGEIDILVSTSVIEVGIDVPNATVMVIESAERFGLAQLHQIRGRVGRGEKQSYCFLYTSDDVNEESIERIKYFATTNDGLKIANFDLQNRGPGEVYGTRQSGIPDLKIARFDNIRFIKKTKTIARKLYEKGIKKIRLFE